ncbi:MAG: hypothetical protein NUV46_00350 [Nanoarchaeota archaeon]|nr:hypothetical protein [Nanoarchaeota archaeon]
MKKLLEKEIKCKEDSFAEKVKEKGGLAGVIGVGVLGFVHTLSHVIPAIGALSMSQLEHSSEEALYLFGYNVEPILSHPVMQIAYLAFVPLSFYYIWNDHKHHKHEKEVRSELLRAKQEIEELKKEKLNLK